MKRSEQQRLEAQLRRQGLSDDQIRSYVRGQQQVIDRVRQPKRAATSRARRQ